MMSELFRFSSRARTWRRVGGGVLRVDLEHARHDAAYPARLRRLAELEPSHFWFVGRRVLVQRLLARYLDGRTEDVIEIGCGTGLMLEALSRQGHRVVGLDLWAAQLCAARRLPSHTVQADGAALPLRERSFGVVLLLDVLEHVDDRIVLREAHRVLRPGGIVLATVPALPWLWSHRDQAAGHLRRYTRRQFRRVLTGAGLSVLDMRYYQCLLFPAVAAARLLGRRGPRASDLEERPFPLLNRALMWINTAEARLSDVVPWPWGSSLAAICLKPR